MSNLVLEERSRAVWVSADAVMEGSDEWEVLEEAYLDGRRGQLISYDSVGGVSVSATAEAVEDAGIPPDDYELISKIHNSDSGTSILDRPDPGVDVRTMDGTGYVDELTLEGAPETSI